LQNTYGQLLKTLKQTGEGLKDEDEESEIHENKMGMFLIK